MTGRWGHGSRVGAGVLLALLVVGGCSGTGSGGGAGGGPDAAGGTDAAPPEEDGTSGGLDAAPTLPTARILAPLEGTRVPQRHPLALEGQVGDPKDHPSQLTVTWESDSAGPLGTSPASASGAVSLEVPAETLAPGSHRLTLTVTNRAGLSASGSVVVVVNHPPSAPVVRILPDPAGTASDLRAEIVTDSADEDGDRVEIERWVWRKDGEVEGGIGATTVPSARTRRGETWEVRVHPTDGFDPGDFGSATVVIANSRPTVDGAGLVPSAGDGFTPFTCQPGAIEDADEDDPAQLFVTWTVNGAAVPVAGSCEPGCAATDGCPPTLRCDLPSGRCLPTDAACADDAACGPPGAVCREGICVRGCGERGCPDGFACDAGSGRCVPTAGACALDGDCAAGEICRGTPDLTATGLVTKGDELACVVTPFDGTVLGAPVTSAGAAIVNAAPEVRHVRLSPEEGDVRTSFRCEVEEAVDPDGDRITFDTLWQIKGPCGACVFETLPGTTSTTLANPSSGEPYFRKGDRVRCRVVPDDGSGAGVPATSNDVLVGNAPPSFGSVSIEPAPTATEADVLVCVPNDPIDPDGDGVSPGAFLWWVNGAVVDATGPTLDGAWFDKGDAVECGVVATDGYDDGEVVDSKLATRIVNMPPALASVTLAPALGAPGQTYTCSPAGWFDLDPPDTDGPGVSVAEAGVDVTAPEFRFRWFRDGADQAVAVNQTAFGPVDLGVGEELWCSVTPFDGQDAGETVLSNVVRMPGPPVVGAVEVTPAEPRTADDLLCAAHGVVDPDGDEVSLAYAWLRADEVVPDYTAATLPSAATTKGDSWACRVTASDAGGDGAPMASAPVVVGNTPPGAPVVAVEPPGAAPGEELSCVVAEDSVDSDGDPVDYTYQWGLDGAAIEGETGETIVSDPSIGCGAWRCTVTPWDDGGAGDPGAGEILTASGWALGFDGATSFAEIGHTAALSLAPLGQLTVEAWVRVTEASAGTIARKGPDGQPGFALRLAADGTPVVDVRTGDGTATVSAAAPLPVDRWAHVAASYNGSLVFLFVNGQLQDTAALTGSAETTAAFHVGGVPGGGADTVLAGRVDELRLSKAGIYSASFGPDLPLEATFGTVGLWHLDEGQGTLFYDASDGGSAGAAVGTAWVEGMCVPSVNAPPGAPVVTVAPDPAYDGSDLTCAILADSVDPDDDAVTYAVSWALDDVPQPAYDGDWTVPASATTVGDRWKCRVVPSDGLLEGPAAFHERVIRGDSWTITGTYGLSPSIAYECTFGLVQLTYSRFTFVDNGTTMTVQPGMNLGATTPCTLSGASARDDGTFDVTCTLYGTCNETYRLAGHFTDPDTFTATYTVTFSGGALCFDCANQTVALTGGRQ